VVTRILTVPPSVTGCRDQRRRAAWQAWRCLLELSEGIDCRPDISRRNSHIKQDPPTGTSLMIADPLQIRMPKLRRSSSWRRAGLCE
jgi:hypothetical protein